MNTSGESQKKLKPKSLVELDFEILCNTEGKEKAIEIMLIIAALKTNGQKRSTKYI